MSTQDRTPLKRGDAVSVIDWTDVPTGGDPFRGRGTYLGSENAVARVRLSDGTVRAFWLGDVTREESS